MVKCEISGTFAETNKENDMENLEKKAREVYEKICIGTAVNKRFGKTFAAGAQWQAKQSPWISVDTPPSDNRDVLLKYVIPKESTKSGEDSVHYCKSKYEDNCWIVTVFVGLCELVDWMEIPK